MMSSELFARYTKLETFRFRGREFAITYLRTIAVAQGVECDMYDFKGDVSRDLGIIKVEQGCSTPRQLIVAGDCTVEGLLAGAGTLTVEAMRGFLPEHHFVQEHPGSEPFDRCLSVGQVMQWSADHGYPLVASEVCYPPWDENRFQNLDC